MIPIRSPISQFANISRPRSCNLPQKIGTRPLRSSNAPVCNLSRIIIELPLVAWSVDANEKVAPASSYGG